MAEPQRRVPTLSELEAAPDRPARRRVPTLAELEAAPDRSARRLPSLAELEAAPDRETPRRDVERVGSLFDAKPTSFAGRNLDVGLAQGFAGLDRLAANAADLVIPDALGGNRLAEYLRSRAGEIEAEAQRRLTPDDEGLGARVLRGVGAAPPTLAGAAPAVAAAGPVAGLAGVGALSRADEGLVGAAKGAVTGAAQGALFPLTRALGLGLPGRVAAQAGGGAGIELAAGGSVEDAATAGILGGLLEPLGGPPRPGARGADPGPVRATAAAAETSTTRPDDTAAPETIAPPAATQEATAPAALEAASVGPAKSSAKEAAQEFEQTGRTPAGYTAQRLGDELIQVTESATGRTSTYDLSTLGATAVPGAQTAPVGTPTVPAREMNAQRAATLFARTGKVPRGYTASRLEDGGVQVTREKDGAVYTFGAAILRSEPAASATDPPRSASAPGSEPPAPAPQTVAIRDTDGPARPLDVSPERGSPLVSIEPRVEAEAQQQLRAATFLGRDFEKPDLDIPQGKVAVNLARIDGPDSLKQAVAEVSRLYAPQIRDARRGEVSFAEQRALADELGLPVETVLARQRGQAANAEELRALRRINLSVVEQAKQTAARIRRGEATDADKRDFIRLFSLAEATQAQFLGARAEVARALGSLRDSESAVQGFDVFKQFPGLRQLTGADPAVRAKAEADPASVLAEVVDQIETPAGVSQFLRKARDPKLKDVAQELYVNSLLTGFRTQAVNVLSNAAVVAQTLAEQYGAAARGAFRSGSDRVTFGEANARLFGTVAGAREGLRLARDVFLRREVDPGKYDVMPGALATYAARLAESPSAAGSTAGRLLGLIGPLVTYPTRLLGTGDAFFRSVASRQELNALAYKAGRAKGYSGRDLAQFTAEFLADPPAAALRQAKTAAEKATFQTPLGPAGASFARAVQALPGGFLIAPFVRTPTNIVKFAAERSPFGLLMRQVRDDLRGNNGKAARDLAQARLAIGTALPVSLVAFAAEGTITGGGPSDPEARRVWFDAGMRPYSVKIGDAFYSYARLEPISTLLGTVADFSEIAGYVDAEGTDKLAGQIIGAVARNVANKTYLTTAIDLAEAISDPDRYAATFFQRQAGSLTVPTLAADVARMQDPTLRDVRSAMEQIKSRIPGYSSTLPARINAWGEPVMLDPGVGPDLVSPIYFSRVQADATKREAARVKANLSLPERRLAGLELSGFEYEQLARLSGQLGKQRVDRMLASPTYQRAQTDDRRRFLIEREYREGKDRARELFELELRRRDPVRVREARRTQRLERRGLR